MSNTAQLKKEYKERIAPALKKQFNYTSSMQIPVLKKIVINQGLGMATADKKIIEVAINELTAIRKLWLRCLARTFLTLNFVRKCPSASW